MEGLNLYYFGYIFLSYLIKNELLVVHLLKLLSYNIVHNNMIYQYTIFTK